MPIQRSPNFQRSLKRELRNETPPPLGVVSGSPLEGGVTLRCPRWGPTRREGAGFFSRYGKCMNTQSPYRYFLYARKSTDDLSRQVRSIDDQLAELRELAQRERLALAIS